MNPRDVHSGRLLRKNVEPNQGALGGNRSAMKRNHDCVLLTTTTTTMMKISTYAPIRIRIHTHTHTHIDELVRALLVAENRNNDN